MTFFIQYHPFYNPHFRTLRRHNNNPLSIIIGYGTGHLKGSRRDARAQWSYLNYSLYKQNIFHLVCNIHRGIFHGPSYVISSNIHHGAVSEIVFKLCLRWRVAWAVWCVLLIVELGGGGLNFIYIQVQQSRVPSSVSLFEKSCQQAHRQLAIIN